MSDLKPCPFCGGAVNIVATHESVERGMCFKFVCQDGSPCLGSGLVTVFFGKDEDAAAKAWNTRPEYKWRSFDEALAKHPAWLGSNDELAAFNAAREMKEDKE